jgi:methylamine dehydrogenase accessory protein MauD
MSTLFYASYGALWLLFLVQAVLLFLVYRHLGLVLLSTAEGIQRDGLGVGEVAPAVSGVTPDGQDVRWAPQPGRSELLVFASPDCEPCAEVFPYINEVATAPTGAGVPVTVIVAGDRGRAMRAAENFASRIPFLAESSTGAFDRYKVRVTPFAFVIGADGRIQAKGLCNQPSSLRRMLVTGGFIDAAEAVERRIRSEDHASGATVAERMALP